MKYIITLLLLVFSASVLDARSVRVRFLYQTDENLLTIQTTDSKNQDMYSIQILLDGTKVSTSKNKNALQKIENFLNEVRGTRNIYTWKDKDVFNCYTIANYYETIFVWSDYQVSKLEETKTPFFTNTFYFYKQD